MSKLTRIDATLLSSFKLLNVGWVMTQQALFSKQINILFQGIGLAPNSCWALAQPTFVYFPTGTVPDRPQGVQGVADPMRLKLQLMIGYLASFILWLIGLCLEEKQLHRDFQANSIKHKRVLSLLFLALEAIRSGYMKYIAPSDLIEIKQKGLHDEGLSVQIL